MLGLHLCDSWIFVRNQKLWIVLDTLMYLNHSLRLISQKDLNSNGLKPSAGYKKISNKDCDPFRILTSLTFAPNLAHETSQTTLSMLAQKHLISPT